MMGELRPQLQCQLFHTLQIDFIGPLPTTKTGKSYVLVVIDEASRFVWAHGVEKPSAESVVSYLTEVVFPLTGIPSCIRSDNDKAFVGVHTSKVFEMLGIGQKAGVIYHPQSQGIVERANKTLKKRLMALINKDRDDWDQWLPYVTMGMRSMVHEGMKVSPAEFLFGIQPRQIQDVLLVTTRPIKPKSVAQGEIRERLEEWRERLLNLRRRASFHLGESAAKRKLDHDEKLIEGFPRPEVGDRVFFRPGTAQKAYPGRIVKRFTYHGPYEVVALISPVVYVLKNPQDGAEFFSHINNLKLVVEGRMDKVEAPLPKRRRSKPRSETSK